MKNYAGCPDIKSLIFHTGICAEDATNSLIADVNRTSKMYWKFTSRSSDCVFRMENNMANVSKKEQQKYNDYVTQVTPTHNVLLNMCKAFLTGGIICLLGQCVLNYCGSLDLSKDISSSWTSLTLIFLSVLLTGLNIFPSIAKFGGAGALVPITGFANSIAAPAIEFQKEGQVFGIGCKIFTIAGPVILYGLVTSSVLGLIYYILMLAGVIG